MNRSRSRRSFSIGRVERFAPPHHRDIARQRRERDRQVVVPAPLVMIEPVAAGNVEPRLARRLERGQPCLSGLAHLRQRGQRVPMVGAFDELPVDAERDRRLGERLQLVVGPEHQDVDARHHARHGLVGDLGEGLFAELEEHQIGAIAQHQEFEMVVPHLRIGFDGAVPRLAHIMVLGDAMRRHHRLAFLQFAQRRHFDRLAVRDQRLDARLPLAEQLRPILIVMSGALLEFREPRLDLHRIGHGMRGDVDPPVQDAILDPEHRRKREHPRRHRAQRRIGNLGADSVEGGDRLGKVHRIVEPEALVVLGPEAGVIGIELLPVLRTVRDLRWQRGNGFFAPFAPIGLPPSFSLALAEHSARGGRMHFFKTFQRLPAQADLNSLAVE